MNDNINNEPNRDDGPIVIIGGGHAGAQLCVALADAKQGARVHLVCEETELPYQRPPLSKSFLKTPDEQPMPHRADTWFAAAGITVHRGDKAVAIDRTQRSVRLASGTVLPYRWLVLATGARARAMPGLAAGLANVAVLRNAEDARRLRTLFDAAQQVTLVGGGFIGLEIAATARALGKAVTVLESAPRLLARAVSPELSAHVLQTHRDAGIDVRLGVAVGGFEVEGDKVVALHVEGRRETVDLLVLGIGSVTEHHLAHDAGIECDNGIVVDAFMRTSDPAVLAIGDCSHFPDSRSGRRVRLESVQNANDQARTAAATLLGTPAPYTALPWFWSEQGSMRLQMVGLMPPDGERHRRPGATPASFSILHYVDGRLVCVESVNAAPDHMAGRKLIEAGKSPAPAAACDPAQPMKSFV
jgi:3-phenylpropionate/trans-cinnamate dioxygenase ferredoxin reductase subunit